MKHRLLGALAIVILALVAWTSRREVSPTIDPTSDPRVSRSSPSAASASPPSSQRSGGGIEHEAEEVDESVAVEKRAPGLWLTVIDPEGDPVEGAELFVEHPHRRTWKALSNGQTALTDADGIWHHPDPEPRRYTLAVRKAGFVTSRTGVTIQEPCESITVRMHRGAVLAGEVRSPSGEGVGGARIEVDGAPQLTTFADESDGGFRISQVFTGEPLRVRIAAPGFVPWETNKKPVGDGEVLDLGTITLSRGAAIRGRVVDEAGRPVIGVTVHARPIKWPVGRSYGPDDVIYMRHSAAATTAGGGRFEIVGLFARGYRLVVGGAGVRPVNISGEDSQTLTFPAGKWLQVRASEEPRHTEIVVSRGIVYEGRVIHPDGQPVAGARVSVVSTQGTHADTTSMTGSFRLRSLPLEEVTLTARRGLVVGAEIRARADDLPPTIELPRGAELEIELRTAGRDELPQVVLLRLQPAGDADPARMREAWSEVEHDFVVFSDLPEGDYEGWIYGRGFVGNLTGGLSFTAGQCVARTVTLDRPPGRDVVLEVRDTFGLAVTEGQVTVDETVYSLNRRAITRIQRTDWGESWGRMGPRPYHMNTYDLDETGRARAVVRAAEARVRIQAPGYGVYERTIQEPEIQLGNWMFTLSPESGFSLTVTTSGELPVAGVRVSFEALYLGDNDFQGIYSFETDADGHLETGSMPAGTYRIIAQTKEERAVVEATAPPGAVPALQMTLTPIRD